MYAINDKFVTFKSFTWGTFVITDACDKIEEVTN